MMADGEPTASMNSFASVQHTMVDQHADDVDCFGRPGSQLGDKIYFKNKFGETVSATPVLVDFMRVFQLGQVDESHGVISGVANRDLLHAVIALYDISLGDMDAETLYATVCAKWSRTIVLVQDLKDAVDDMTARNIKRRRKIEESKKEGKETQDEEKVDWTRRLDVEADTLKEEESVASAFADVFSDTDEDEEEDEEDDEEEENYSKGIHSFIAKSLECHKKRRNCEGIVPKDLVGIEDRLLACATFEKKFIQHKERVIHLTLICVRPRYRKYKLGRYLLSKCVAPIVVGHHEAVVVHADNSAVEFFRKFGFSDDIILNSKWSELAEAFTNCTLMTYLPGFSGYTLLYTAVSKDIDPDLHEIDQELNIWRAKSKEAYQGQLCCMMKFRHEILQLKNLVRSQNDLLNKLVTDSDQIRRNKLLIEKEMAQLQLDAVRNAFSEVTSPLKEADDNTTEFIKQLEDQVAAISTVTEPETSSPRPLSISSEIISRFIQGMEMDRSFQVRYTVSSILKASSNPSLNSKFELSLSSLLDPNMETELYYCGSLEKPNRLKHILQQGFTEEDFSYGEFGRGLYFSKYPSKAAQFSDLGKLMEVRVGLGKVETAMRCDRTRKSPSAGFDSIICPGRLYRPSNQGEVAMLSQEYIVFDIGQVLPLCIIRYSAYPGS